MYRSFISSLALTLALVASQPAFACGEGLLNMGNGLRYQGYLAPRPATVLIYDDMRQPPSQRVAVYHGLARAGHRLTIAHSPDELAQAMGQGRSYDIVIAGLETVDAVSATTSKATPAPKLLPVVARSQRDASTVHQRFDLFLLDSASLGQYLKLINQLMKG